MADLHPVEFLQRHPLFTTRQFALLCGRGVDSASRTLNGLANGSTLVCVTRGIWAQPGHPHFSVLGAVLYLLQSEQGHVSFLTALHHHGLIEQIPGTIQVATTGHGRKLSSPIGRFEFFQMQPRMMRSGIEMQGSHAPYPMATPEKALLDTLYIATRRGNRFSRLPELDLEAIDPATFKALLAEQIPEGAVRRAVCRRLSSLAPALLP